MEDKKYTKEDVAKICSMVTFLLGGIPNSNKNTKNQLEELYKAYLSDLTSNPLYAINRFNDLTKALFS